MSEKLPSFLLKSEEHKIPSRDLRRYKLPFVDATLKRIAEILKTVYSQADTASNRGLLQILEARTKLTFLLSFIILTSILQKNFSLLVILIFIFVLFPLSGLNLFSILRKAFWPLFFFGFLVVSPAMLNIVSGGEIWLKLFQFKHEHTFRIYHIPSAIGISKEGMIVFSRLFLKICNSVFLTLLVMSTTSFGSIMKALRMFRVPDIMLFAITLSYKFIFILSKTTAETYLALRSRWVKKNNDMESGRIIAGRIEYIFRRSWIKYEEVYRAMVARGFSGRVNLCFEGKFKLKDLVFVIVFICIGILGISLSK